MDQVSKYFNAEKNESLVFILVGLTAIILSGYYLIKIKQPFYNGIAYPLITIALIQIIVGTSVYIRSPKDIVRVNQIIESNLQKVQTEEIPRMQTVMKNFSIYKKIEITLIVLGLFLYFFFQPASFMKGIGFGMALQAGFMLLLDFFAESRGREYIHFLEIGF